MQDHSIVAGFPEMWEQVYAKYHGFFECAVQLQPIAREMFHAPIKGELHVILGHMAAAAANSHGALLMLVLNGYGHDAMKIARSLFEIELNMVRLKAHPEELADFVDYNIIQQHQFYETLDEEQKQQVSPARYEQMIRDYNTVLPRFTTGRDKTIPRNEWCKVSLYKRAKEAGQPYLDFYGTFYRHVSSMHHMDIGGIIAHADQQLNAHMAPSWEHLDDALVATGFSLRCISHFDEIARLGFKDRIENGPNELYAAALKAL